MFDILQILLSESFWSASLRIATPLIFGVLGALLCEKSGVLNLGIEGIFVAGAMVGWMAVWLGAGLWGGVLAAALAGALFGLLHGILTVPLGLSQHVSGLAITLFASSLSYFSYRTALPTVSSPPRSWLCSWLRSARRRSTRCPRRRQLCSPLRNQLGCQASD